MRGPLVAAILGLVLVAPAVAPAAEAAKGPAGYEIELSCPSDETYGDPREGYLYEGCPQRARDEADLLGQPVFVVDPKDPDRVAFHSLHGSHDRDGPSDHSRDGQTHTVFASTDHGVHWSDNPYTPSDAGLDAEESYGQYAAAAVDGDGRLHLASLYATRQDEASPLRWTLATWRLPGITSVEDSEAFSGATLLDAPNGSRIRTPWLVRAGGVNGTVTLTWWEGAGDDGAIRAATAVDGSYRRLNLTGAAAPCADGSNAASHDGLVYVACRRPGGALDLLEIEPRTGRVTVAGTIGLPAGDPHLAVGAEGQTAVASIRVADGNVEASLAFGWSGSRWGPVRQVGDALTNASDERVLDAGIQAMRIRPRSGALHVVYMERTPPSDDVTSPVTSRTESGYAKRLAVFHPSHGPVTQLDLPVGNALARDDVEWVSDANRDAFRGRRDSLTLFPGQDGTVREIVAYGDTGVIGYAHVLEDPGDLAAPAPPPAPTTPNPVVDPAGAATSSAAGTTSGAKLLVGVGVAGMALAMVARLLLTRNRTPSEVPDLTGDER